MVLCILEPVVLGAAVVVGLGSRMATRVVVGAKLVEVLKQGVGWRLHLGRWAILLLEGRVGGVGW